MHDFALLKRPLKNNRFAIAANTDSPQVAFSIVPERRLFQTTLTADAFAHALTIPGRQDDFAGTLRHTTGFGWRLCDYFGRQAGGDAGGIGCKTLLRSRRGRMGFLNMLLQPVFPNPN